MKTKNQIIDNKHYILEVETKRRMKPEMSYKWFYNDGKCYIELKTPFAKYFFKSTDNIRSYIENYAFNFSKLVNDCYKYKWCEKEVNELNDWFKQIKTVVKDFDLQIEYKR